MNPTLDELRYPIGQPDFTVAVTPKLRQQLINDIRYLPSLVEVAVQHLDAHQLQHPYRPGGWTVAQVVHHLADSHQNGLIRLKLALTEQQPIIKPYDEGAWAMLPDYIHTPINISITLLHSLHRKWVEILEHMQENDWKRDFYHPEAKVIMNLDQHLVNYAWHGKHHLAHIENLIEREAWK